MSYDLLIFHDTMKDPETRTATCSPRAAKARAMRLAAKLGVCVDVFVTGGAHDVAANYLGTATPYSMLPGDAYWRREV